MEKVIPPAAPAAEAPVESATDPEDPVVASPLFRITPPVPNPTLELCNVTLPDALDVDPPPLETVTEPPFEVPPEPPDIATSPPAVEPTPAVAYKAPPAPALAVPAEIITLPPTDLPSPTPKLRFPDELEVD